MELAAELTREDRWDFSCPDWKERLRDGRSLMPELPLDQVAAARAINIFNKMRLPDVAGHPELREAGGDWFRELVGALHGSIDETGLRHVREPLLLVPKKNSKTTNSAALMLTSVLVDPEPSQYYGLYGPTQEIAERSYAQAVGIIGADREGVLQSRFHVRDHLKTIVDLKTGTILKVSTFDEKVATGAIPKGLLIEELHVLGKIAYAARVLGQLRGGLMARPGGFMVKITTQSDEPPTGVFKADLQLARAIRDGVVRGPAASVLPLLYEFPEEVQRDQEKVWRDPKIWHRVNPNMGRSLRLDLLIADYETAKTKGEEEERRWVSQHLNIEIGLALHSDRWIGVDYWEGAADETIAIEALIERCDVVVAGIDGGGLDDLLGLTLIGRCRETRDWLTWSHAWAHEDVFQRRKEIVSRLEDFIAEGTLTRCTHPTQDVEELVEILVRLNEAGLLPEKHAVGLDPQGVGAIVDAAVSRGIADEQMVGIPQGFRLSSAVWSTERKLKDGTLWHAAQALMAWCVGNAKVEQRGNAVLITKQAAGKAKIDPLIALFNAATLMSRSPEAAGGSVYDSRGLLIV